MEYKRSAGILLHPTSLPGKYGIGELGIEAINFIDFLDNSGQKLWQIFPLGPTGYGDSPYQNFSTFAGNPYLISLEILFEEGLLSKTELDMMPISDPHKVDYGSIYVNKLKILRIAYENMKKMGNSILHECEDFCENNKDWLEDYALFMAVKNYHNGIVWKDWDREIAFREDDAISKWKVMLLDDVGFQKFLQFKFATQWKVVKDYANEKGIQIIGDLPIFVAYDSSDVWANTSLFTIDSEGNQETVAGVPPDYFSKTGQLWGNPLYKWDIMEKDNFKWWQRRLQKMYELVDIVRIDHFRGLEAYWEIPGDAETAINGKWVKAPGKKLFQTFKNTFGNVKILAEDLGVITPEVEELRDSFNLPGMKILQFAFGEDGDRKFLPHNHIKNCCIYTGTHDNDTTKGFFDNERNSKSGIYEWAQKYLNFYGDDICTALIVEAYKSVANIVIIPMQDILNLGTDARMNFPSKLGGNWMWRFSWDQLPSELSKRYKNMTKMFER
ncbi:MAG: 4-alpha-glucanotransferase [Bacteroidetes bacterium]|nr:4-alpha-glucanotransferase [Bacteroidota bacterium]MBU1114588.1 4-alpha-glucanotransferase [Bacteroidota bacterium]MBU1799626.1 4-alpha-glucanotransferase [Bacteroidota bacterium]